MSKPPGTHERTVAAELPHSKNKESMSCPVTFYNVWESCTWCELLINQEQEQTITSQYFIKGRSAAPLRWKHIFIIMIIIIALELMDSWFDHTDRKWQDEKVTYDSCELDVGFPGQLPHTLLQTVRPFCHFLRPPGRNVSQPLRNLWHGSALRGAWT